MTAGHPLLYPASLGFDVHFHSVACAVVIFVDITASEYFYKAFMAAPNKCYSIAYVLIAFSLLLMGNPKRRYIPLHCQS